MMPTACGFCKKVPSFGVGGGGGGSYLVKMLLANHRDAKLADLILLAPTMYMDPARKQDWFHAGNLL